MKATFTDYVKHLMKIKTISEPTFLKDFEQESQQLHELKKLSRESPANKRTLIERDLLLLKHGIEGEAKVYYELKNSFIPMLCLHDIRIPYKDYYAQFDFVIITNKLIYILETKKLSGDIEVNGDGDFIRIIKNKHGNIIKKEGMYSPISQSERQVNILREVLLREELIKTLPIKSAVIIANPKSIINKTYSPNRIKEKLYKHDQIGQLLKTEMAKEKDRDILEKQQFNIARFLMEKHEPLKIDYAAKYAVHNIELIPELELASAVDTTELDSKEKDIYAMLKAYRLETSRKGNLKPYWVFTNSELDEIVERRPRNIADLIAIKGFGETKAAKYGAAILEIVNK